jgi:hypothetical protein
MPKAMTRINGLFNRDGKIGRIPVSKTVGYENYIHDKNGDDEQFVPGTKVPKLRTYHAGPNTVVVFDDEVDALIEGLRAERDNPTASTPRPPRAAGARKREASDAR